MVAVLVSSVYNVLAGVTEVAPTTLLAAEVF